MSYYERVPIDFHKNLNYRIEVRERCVKEKMFRKAMRKACSEDVLFFFSTFCWLFEPRPRFDENGSRLPKMIPFIPWEHQVPAVREIVKNLGSNDIGVFKSRGEGLSWIGVLLAVWEWTFHDMTKIGLVSNTEKKADDPGNLDSLGAKIDWELTKLPTWMVGEKGKDFTRNLADHAWVNHRNYAQINAFAATADAGRAGRYTWFLGDELAFWDAGKDRKFMESIRESTECRFAISTPNGSDGAFYDMIHVPSNVAKIRIHWSQNPYKNRGLYKMIDGVPKAVDPDSNPLPAEYNPPSQDVLNMFGRLRTKGFRLDKNLRSPWYDKQCDRGDATPQSIAQELDLDFAGSMYRVFTPEFTEKAKDTTRLPLLEGELDWHPETLDTDFTGRDGGQCKLWVQLDAMGSPPIGSYVVAADIGSGLGGSHTSNSVCEVINRVTCEQVMEFASNTIEPSEFGELCVAVAKWFYDAYLGWEANFGGGFTNRVKSLGYFNIYRREVLWRQGKKKSKEIGWWTDDRSKDLLFSTFHRKVKAGEVIVRSDALLRECGEYVRMGPQSKIEHVKSVSTKDESSRGKAHGDRVIAFGLAVQLMEDRPVLDRAVVEEKKGPPPPDTLAWRVQEWEREDRPSDGWDDQTLWDVSADQGFLD